MANTIIDHLTIKVYCYFYSSSASISMVAINSSVFLQLLQLHMSVHFSLFLWHVQFPEVHFVFPDLQLQTYHSMHASGAGKLHVIIAISLDPGPPASIYQPEIRIYRIDTFWVERHDTLMPRIRNTV